MTAHLGLADDALRLGGSLQLDVVALAKALTHGSGASYSLGIRARIAGELSQFSAGPLLRKDLDILNSVAGADQLGALGPAAEAALARILGDDGSSL
jgi:hypothetical protein